MKSTPSELAEPTPAAQTGGGAHGARVTSDYHRYPPRILAGLQPTTQLHLGHYFGAIKYQIDLHHEYPFRTFCLIADYHALTRNRAADEIRKGVLRVATAYLALGLDPRKAILFRQSDVPGVCELAWILSTRCNHSVVARIPTFRLAPKHDQTLGLLSYPVLQAADILSMRATLVPTSRDQLAHVELAANLAKRANKHMGRDVFPIPKSRLIDHGVVKGLDGRKMHRSNHNSIELFGRFEYLRSRVNAIVTSPQPLGTPIDPERCTVFHLLSLVSSETKTTQLRSEYQAGSISFADAKRQLHYAILEYFAPFEDRYYDLIERPDLVLDVLSDGFRTARREASDVLELVRELLGMRDTARLTET